MTEVARRLPTVLVVLLVLCRTASADQFTVTGGNITSVDPLFHATMFRLMGDDFSLGGVASPITVQNSCFPCSTDNPSIRISGSLGNPVFNIFGGDPGRFAGVDYPHVFLTGQMSVSTPGFAGSMLLETTTITLPFDFSAQLTGYPDTFNPFGLGPGPTPIFHGEMFTGSGTVTANFVDEHRTCCFGAGELFHLQDATFVFGPSAAPTPEPATLVLLAIGAAAAFARARRSFPPL